MKPVPPMTRILKTPDYFEENGVSADLRLKKRYRPLSVAGPAH